VVNLSSTRSQAQILVPWDDLAGQSWRLTDTLAGSVYERDGLHMRNPGLYPDLVPWSYHLFEFSPAK
jgi:hypothetical protein